MTEAEFKQRLAEARDLLGNLDDAVDELLEIDVPCAKPMTQKEARRRIKAYAVIITALTKKLTWDEDVSAVEPADATRRE